MKLIQSQYIINLVNQELYPFQLEHRLSIFDNMENDILNILGFRPNSTYQFVIAIGHIYRNKFNSKSTDYLFTEEDIKRCFTLTNDIEASFKKELFSYLKAISTEVGSEKHRYNDLLDEDISWRKPLIKTPKGYLGINLIPNTFGIFSQIEYLLKQKCRNDQRAKIVLEKYYKNRAKYLEDRSFEILKNIFHKDVFKNLKYKYKGKTYETDILVKYDNKIIVVETKSSSLRLGSKVGNRTKLNKDLNAIIGDSFKQAKRTEEYIRSEAKPCFFQGKKELKIEKHKHLENISYLYLFRKTISIDSKFKTSRVARNI